MQIARQEIHVAVAVEVGCSDHARKLGDRERLQAWTENDRDRRLRQQWIEALRRGEDPFTPELLESLR